MACTTEEKNTRRLSKSEDQQIISSMITSEFWALSGREVPKYIPHEYGPIDTALCLDLSWVSIWCRRVVISLREFRSCRWPVLGIHYPNSFGTPERESNPFVPLVLYWASCNLGIGQTGVPPE